MVGSVPLYRPIIGLQVHSRPNSTLEKREREMGSEYQTHGLVSDSAAAGRSTRAAAGRSSRADSMGAGRRSRLASVPTRARVGRSLTKLPVSRPSFAVYIDDDDFYVSS